LLSQWLRTPTHNVAAVLIDILLGGLVSFLTLITGGYLVFKK
jgi:hypothetical protein